MPLITPDVSQVESNNLENGTYRARITAHEVGTSGAGNQKIIVHFDVQGPNNKTLKREAHIPTSGKGVFAYERFLRALKFTEVADQLRLAMRDKTVPPPAFDTDAINGQEVNLVITQQMYQGEPRDQIDSYLPA